MSAIKDTQHGITFIYTNFYDQFKNNLSAKGVVLKSSSEVTVMNESQHQEYLDWSSQKDAGKQALSKTLLDLRESRKRFSYLLTEIEDILKRD